MTLHCAAPQACRFKPIYHLLVTLYFFRHVSIDRDFVADFAHPITVRRIHKGPAFHY